VLLSSSLRSLEVKDFKNYMRLGIEVAGGIYHTARLGDKQKIKQA
jgi:hypothetical protein